MRFLLNKLFLPLSVLLLLACGCATSPPGRAIATLRLHNPTQSGEAAIVEIPVGHLAPPDLVNWERVRLVHNGETVPFALREGKSRWQADLIAPVRSPRAEDLLAFSLAVPPGQWSQVELMNEPAAATSALARRAGVLSVTYPNLRAVIDERSGQLTELSAYGDSILQQPLRMEFFEVESGVANFEKAMGPSYSRTPATLKKSRVLLPARARLASSSSTAAMTEINFVLQSESGLAVGLTYRIYANGQVEIISDERPWSGDSPWLKHGLEYRLALTGQKELLRDFQTHFPLYGFRDYPAAVRGVGTLHRGAKVMTFELGEESINGRFWHRRLAVFPQRQNDNPESQLELVDKGLVVQVTPLQSAPLSSAVAVEYSDEAKSVGDIFVGELGKAGVRVAPSTQATKSAITLKLGKDAASYGVSGDGFAIRSPSKENQFEVIAGTKFGLFKGTSEIIQHFNSQGSVKTIPLVARNPVVDLRASGYGGAGHEVDFPFGSDADWERAFDGMMQTGMNVMTDLGMWGNWKMPVFFKYMPELQTTATNAHDEVTGANFSEFAKHREHGLKLLKYLQARGVKVWLWLPVGTIPTTFHEKYPDATVPGNGKIPRFMHPKYRQLLDAYFKELLEVYPVDGFVLIRDDNGGIDQTDEWKKYLAGSRTKHAVWEQYLIMYDLLRSMKFKGQIAVYPYFDIYEPRLETLLPKDLLIVGHGSGLGMLTRDFKTTGPMGDTWLDNLYTSFRLPTSSKMKRLLGDRSSYWIGGAYCGTELPWDAVGYFGWQPTAAVNTFRYETGERIFGKANALKFVAFVEAYEKLWDLMNVPLLPYDWYSLSESERVKVSQAARQGLTVYRQRLNELQSGSGAKADAKWFAHVNHYEAFFNYYFRRVELLGKMHDLVASHRATEKSVGPLPDSVRQQLVTMQSEVVALARTYEKQAATVPGSMMADTRTMGITSPFNELFYTGFDASLDKAPGAKVKQFDGAIRVAPPTLKPGESFELEIELENRGCLPWITGAGNDLIFKGDAARLGLPAKWSYEGEPMAFGDKRTIKLRGTAPAQLGTAKIVINFQPSYRGWVPFSQMVEIK